MDIINKVLNRNDKTTQIQNELKSLLVRRESVVSVVQSEIQHLEEEKRTILTKAGEKAYEGWKKEQPVEEELEQLWNKVRDLESQISEKEAKKKELEGRYDEEISLLKRNLNIPEFTVGNVSSERKRCPTCGAVGGSNDAFCEKCGAELM